MSVTKQLMGPIDFHMEKKNNMSPSTVPVWLPTFLKISSCVFIRIKKFGYTLDTHFTNYK